jgi:hypothetical protein
VLTWRDWAWILAARSAPCAGGRTSPPEQAPGTRKGQAHHLWALRAGGGRHLSVVDAVASVRGLPYGPWPWFKSLTIGAAARCAYASHLPRNALPRESDDAWTAIPVIDVRTIDTWKLFQHPAALPGGRAPLSQNRRLGACEKFSRAEEMARSINALGMSVDFHLLCPQEHTWHGSTSFLCSSTACQGVPVVPCGVPLSPRALRPGASAAQAIGARPQQGQTQTCDKGT